METIKAEYERIEKDLDEFDKSTLMKSVTSSGLSVEEAVKIITQNSPKKNIPVTEKADIKPQNSNDKGEQKSDKI
jgi:hypothetical protein